MTVTVGNIIPAKEAENAQTPQYTSDGGETIIDKFTATNTSAGVVTISVNIIPDAGSASNANLIVDTKSLQVDETYTFPELVGHTMADGDFISTIASAATSITIRASGRFVT